MVKWSKSVFKNFSYVTGAVVVGFCFSVQSSNASDFFSNIQLADVSSDMKQSSAGNTGFYVGVNYVGHADFGNTSLKYRSTEEVPWKLDSDVAASAQVGYDFGLARIDLKGVATDGGIDKIDGNDVGNNRSNVGVVTANAYWDIMRTEIDKDIYVVPYVGVGGGIIGFRTKGVSTVDPTDGSGANNGGDGHNGVGYAATAHLGFNVEIMDHFSVVAAYQHVRGMGGHDTTAINLGEVGLRLTF